MNGDRPEVTCEVELSIFARNKHGELAKILNTAAMANGEDLRKIITYNLSSLGDYGMLRIVVTEDHRAIYDRLVAAGFSVSDSPVLIYNKPGARGVEAMREIAGKLGNENKINIEYAYESSAGDIILKVDDINNAHDALTR